MVFFATTLSANLPRTRSGAQSVRTHSTEVSHSYHRGFRVHRVDVCNFWFSFSVLYRARDVVGTALNPSRSRFSEWLVFTIPHRSSPFVPKRG